uniref:Protein kinase domain-containing protein n=1 Tax=Parascaris equorum TaxID=6256 RepID=A0A914S7M1_PAREQ
MGDGSVPWPNKKGDYSLEDSIGVGATATVYKVSRGEYIFTDKFAVVVVRKRVFPTGIWTERLFWLNN